jgi:hypothetical protein
MKNIGKIAVHLFVVLCIIATVASICYKYYYEPEQRAKDYKEAMNRATERWIKDSETSIWMHNNYTEDKIIMSLFDNITTVYPFLYAQGKILLDDASVLINDISIENFNKTETQYQLCVLLNNAVVENRTKYVERIKSNYSGMLYYESFEDVIDYNEERASQYLYKSYYEKDETYYLLDWTTDLNKIKSQLDFIKGIIDEG